MVRRAGSFSPHHPSCPRRGVTSPVAGCFPLGGEQGLTFQGSYPREAFSFIHIIPAHRRGQWGQWSCWATPGWEGNWRGENHHPWCVSAPLSHSLGLLGGGDTLHTAQNSTSDCEPLREGMALGRCIFWALVSHNLEILYSSYGLSSRVLASFITEEPRDTASFGC